MKPWIPDQLPLTSLRPGQLISPLGRASDALARYDGLLQGMVNAELMLSPLLNQEAVLSSRIEGTQATVGELLEKDVGEEFDREKEDDVEEVANYRQAARDAAQHMEDRHLSLQMIRMLHQVLMHGVRGQDKEPGRFRVEQNWIGAKGCPIEKASFVPPSPMIIQEHLESWERYIAGEDLDPLIQAAVMHAQFEIIHPFIDGNGRIGRLLIPLFLFSKKRIYRPMFYLSGYLERHRDEYYSRLRAITDKGEWNEWIEFFLQAVAIQAAENTSAAVAIHSLYERMKDEVQKATKSKYSARITDMLFRRPIFRVKTMGELAEIPNASAHKTVALLVQAGIAKQMREGTGRKAALYVFPQLLNLVEGREIF
jgi:cell filamentation protein, protein adenylyltransferase